jgi:2,5-diketo-D-gluconate reductase B
MGDVVLTVQGTAIPRIGLGTWLLDGREATEGVRDALEIGYRHIDTARGYGNEAEVGAGIAASGVDRREIFVTTKIGPSDEGKLRHPGVSNFPAGMLEHALAITPLLADQVEYHPFLAQDALLQLVAERDLTLTAYSPLGRGKVGRDSTLAEIGQAHGKSAGQVALRWLVEQPNVTAVPKASSHERRVENIDVFDFELTDRDRERIAALHKDDREIDPSWAPDWDE